MKDIKAGDRIKITYASSANWVALAQEDRLVSKPGTSEVFEVLAIENELRSPVYGGRKRRVYTVTVRSEDGKPSMVEYSSSQRLSVLTEPAGQAAGPTEIRGAEFSLQAEGFQPTIWSL